MLSKGNGGAYHLCFETNDMEGALVHARNNGCVVLASPVPAVAFQGRRIAWIYTPSRQLFEIVEAKTAK
jgi:methylmalonyl-CoA/ethylmalonyl-CoA epimerase